MTQEQIDLLVSVAIVLVAGLMFAHGFRAGQHLA